MLSSLGYLTGGSAAAEAGQVLADPKDKIELVNRLEQAVELMGRNRHADAVEVLEALSVEEPESGHILSRLGESLLVTRNYKRAALIYRRLIRIVPEDEIPLVNLGSLAVMNKEHEQAVGYFESALEINPNQVEALLNLGYLNHRVLFNRQKAKAYYSRFLEAAPSDRQAAQIRSLLEQL